MPLCKPQNANRARGEVTAILCGRKVRLCVTLGALATLEGHFGVRGLDALAERLRLLDASDLLAVLTALVIDDEPLNGDDIALTEAVAAVVSAFEALNG